MKLFPPPRFAPIAAKGIVTDLWFEWMRSVYAYAGFSDQEIYSTAFVGGPSTYPIYGANTMVAIPGSGDLKAPQMPDGSTSGRTSSFCLPNNYRVGTDILPFIKWACTTAAAGNAVLRLISGAINDGAALVEDSEDITASSVAVAGAPITTEFAAIDGAPLAKGSYVHLCPLRIGGDAADTLAATCALLGVGFKYQVDGVGHEKAFP